MQRLSKVLAAAGVASRRACEKLIFSSAIKVNGEVVTIPYMLVDPTRDSICLNDYPIRHSEAKVYYMVNKPRGYICSNSRIGSKKLVIDLFGGERRRLFTVGRLDQDTTGLLLVTNDGHFSQKVIHPSNNLTKEYLVKVKQEITHQHLYILAQGVFIERKKIKPISVKKIRRGTMKVRVREGKNREVRRMIQDAGLDLLSLVRIRIGALHLGFLREGEWRELNAKERVLIFS